jgi:hyperosmotically inducible periplasmic protein
MVFKPQTFHEVPPQAEIDDPTDAALEATVAAALGRAGLVDANRVSVTTKGAAVTLDGLVGSSAEVDAAGEVARQVEGVKIVDNRLRIQAAEV